METMAHILKCCVHSPSLFLHITYDSHRVSSHWITVMLSLDLWKYPWNLQCITRIMKTLFKTATVSTKACLTTSKIIKLLKTANNFIKVVKTPTHLRIWTISVHTVGDTELNAPGNVALVAAVVLMGVVKAYVGNCEWAFCDFFFSWNTVFASGKMHFPTDCSSILQGSLKKRFIDILMKNYCFIINLLVVFSTRIQLPWKDCAS